MLKYILYGMAAQAFITAGLAALHAITLSVGQQAIAGLLLAGLAAAAWAFQKN